MVCCLCRGKESLSSQLQIVQPSIIQPPDMAQNVVYFHLIDSINCMKLSGSPNDHIATSEDRAMENGMFRNCWEATCLTEPFPHFCLYKIWFSLVPVLLHVQTYQS